MDNNRSDLLKVVARGRSGDMVKGYLDAVTDLDKFKDTSLSSDEIRVYPAGSSSTSVLKVDSLKALFFVKSFDGNPDYREAQYFADAPVYQGIWVRVRFFDQEVIEGIMENSIRPFVEPGLLLTLPDTESNNEAAYVIKSSLNELHILGVSASLPTRREIAS
jgi:hypothetical protein